MRMRMKMKMKMRIKIRIKIRTKTRVGSENDGGEVVTPCLSAKFIGTVQFPGYKPHTNPKRKF